MVKQDQGVIFLMGPTATGKSGLAMSLADRLPVELVNVDSAQVYRGMDIGTAKPSREVLQEYPHHLIDIRDPADPYSAADFRNDVLQVIEEIHQRGNIPLLVGGTMLYFKALKEGLAKMPASDAVTRQALEDEARAKGLKAMHEELEKVDPKAAGNIHPNNRQRLVRALEVYRISGRPISQFWDEGEQQGLPWPLLEIALVTGDRSILHDRIEARFKQMLNDGLVKEVKALYDRGDLHPDLSSIRSVGYRQVWDYLSGELSYSQMQERGVVATRQLAKRQFTWLNSWEGTSRLDMDDPNLLEAALDLINEAPYKFQ